MKVLLLSVTERGEEDLCGPHVAKMLLHHFPAATIVQQSTGAEAEEIRKALEANEDCNFILTTGGIGIAAKNVTPEVTSKHCERMLPGVAELLRMELYKQLTPYSVLSRGVAGIRGNTIIINLPSSLKAALLCTRLLVPILTHGPQMLEGKEHDSFDPGIMGMGSKQTG
jgi:molybdopterin adenylyltransferase